MCVQCTLTFIGRQFFKRWRDECDDEDDDCHYGEAHTARLRIVWHNSLWNETKDCNNFFTVGLLVYLLYNEGQSGHFTFTDSNSIPIVKWETFRAELSFMFADLTDEQHAFMLLRHVVQDKNENVQTIAEICYLSMNKIVEFLRYIMSSLNYHYISGWCHYSMKNSATKISLV